LNRQRGRVTSRWCGVIAALLLLAAPLAVARVETTFEGVVAKIRDRDFKQAVTELQELADRGDARAQYLLGLAYLEAKWVPQDIPQAISWLQIAADGYDGSYARSAADEARQTLLKVGSQVSGADLLRSDQITAAFLQSYNSSVAAGVDRGSKALQAAASGVAAAAGSGDDAPEVVVGCAVDPTLRGCAEDVARIPGDRCSGQFPKPDSEATAKGPGANIRRPVYPLGSLRQAWEGKVVVLVHVDRSGYVCRVTLVNGSGIGEVDHAVLDAVRFWRLVPAQSRGEPVESLFRGGVEFRMSDFQFD
jgi:TonB family protein